MLRIIKRFKCPVCKLNILQLTWTVKTTICPKCGNTASVQDIKKGGKK